MLPFIEIFGLQLQTYSIISVMGLLITAVVSVYLGKEKGIAPDKTFVMVIVSSVGLFIGAHILFALTNINEIIVLFKNIGNYDFASFMSELFTCVGGMVFYGGLIGATLALLIYTHISKQINRRDAFDVFAVSIPLFHTFGRIGCFFSGCCFGVESDFGITTYLNTSATHYGVSRFPVQLLEAFINLLIFILLLILFKRQKLIGKLFILYLALYAPARFVLEFFRGDSIRGFIFGISTSQCISILILIALGVYLIIKSERYSSKTY